MRHYGLRDDRWDRIKDLLPGRECHVGGTAADNRLFVEAVLFRFRAGVPWRDLPARFGDWKIVSALQSMVRRAEFSQRIFKLLASDHDNSYMMIDATTVRAHQHSDGAQKKVNKRLGRSRGGLPRFGNPTEVMLTPGQTHDLACAEPLLGEVDPEALICDRGYGRSAARRSRAARNHSGDPAQSQP